MTKWPITIALLMTLSPIGSATNISFELDPFEGTTVRNSPGRQVVGGEFFVAFHTATEQFVFNETAFAMGNQIHFANGQFNAIPTTGVNAVVLLNTDNDNNPLTPFGAGNAADLLASRITEHGPGVFIYFNSSLNLPRLVYSDDLASNTADLRILARMLNLMGQPGIDALSTFTEANFAIAESPQATPEPSSLALLGGGLLMVGLPAVRRRLRSDRQDDRRG